MEDVVLGMRIPEKGGGMIIMNQEEMKGTIGTGLQAKDVARTPVKITAQCKMSSFSAQGDY